MATTTFRITRDGKVLKTITIDNDAVAQLRSAVGVLGGTLEYFRFPCLMATEFGMIIIADGCDDGSFSGVIVKVGDELGIYTVGERRSDFIPEKFTDYVLLGR